MTTKKTEDANKLYEQIRRARRAEAEELVNAGRQDFWFYEVTVEGETVWIGAAGPATAKSRAKDTESTGRTQCVVTHLMVLNHYINEEAS